MKVNGAGRYDDGDDVVESSISYTLGAHLEVLTLTGSNPLDGTGNELGNLLEGNGAANNLRGEAGDDTLQGNGGDDTLRGGAGDDIIAGRDGTDQVVYLGQKDDYKITYDADSDGWIVEDANGTDGDGTDEGRDELSGIESMLFADKGVVDLTQGLSLSIDNISQIEGTGADTAFNFTVSLSAASSSPVSVNYSVQSGTASAGTDFTPVSGVLTFSPDETEKTIRVPVKADTLTEADETFTVVLSNPIGASLVQASGTGTIQNDDQTRLAISAVSLNEGNGGSQDAILTVTLSSAASQPVTVAYATADGTAVAGSDYTASTGTVTFPAGSTSQQIRIPVGGDTAVETDESFSVTLSKPGNAVIATASAAVTLKNDDQAVLSIASTQISEGNAGSQNVDLTLTLSAPASQPVTVDYTTVNGTALAGSDYTAKTGTVTFPAGTIRQTISIPVSGDKVVEANETFSVTLGRARNATVSSVAGSAAVTLINDDQPVLSLADVRLNEGNSGSNEAVITVSLSGASPQVVTVDYTTANFSAVAGSDYTASTGTLSFPAGSTSQQIRIPIVGDALVETDEQFTVSLSNAQNAVLAASNTATVSLTNDDTPSLSVAAVQVQEGNNGTTEAVVTVSLSSTSSQAVSVNYGTVDGTALAGSDYSAVSGNLSFAPGETTQQIRVLVNGDTEAEADETFTVNLSEAVGATLDTSSRQAVVTVRNDDPASTPSTPTTPTTGDTGTTGGTGGTGSSGGTTTPATSLTPPNPFVSNGGFELDLDETDSILQGTDLNDRIGGLGGNDTLDGTAGDDWLDGGAGADSLMGGDGYDTLMGGKGGDNLSGGNGDDYLDGGLFDVTDRTSAPDTLDGGEGNNTIISGAGDDSISAGGGNDSIDSGAGNDSIDAGGGNDSIDSGAGNDKVWTYGDSLSVTLGNGDDYILSWYGKTGQVLCGAGNDEIDFADSSYVLFDGGDGNDSIWSGTGSEKSTLLGGSGDDLIGYQFDGGQGYMGGSQYLDGGAGKDRLYGGGENDTLLGGQGADTLEGGSGDDIFIFNLGDSGVGKDNRDLIRDFNTASTAEVIDLHGLSSQALSFQGSKAFSAANQVRYALDVPTSSTVIQINLDADTSTVEMEIGLVGLKGLTAGDFILTATA